MKYILIFILLLSSTFTFSQGSKSYLIDNTDILQLKSFVDSINNIDIIEPTQNIFLSKRQAICDILFYRGDSIKEIQGDVNAGVDIPQILKIYPSCTVASNQLVTLENGSRPETTKYINTIIVPIEMFVTSIYLDTTKFNTEVKSLSNILIPQITFPTSIKNSFSAIQFKSYNQSEPLSPIYQEYISYHSKLLNHFSEFFNKENVSNLNVDQFLRLSNTTKGAILLRQMNVDIFKYYLGNYIRHENKDVSNYLSLSVNLNKIFNSVDQEKSLKLVLSMAEDENLDLYNRYRLLILAQKINRLSETKDIFNMNNEKVNQTIDRFPEPINSKIKKRNGY